MRPFLNSMKKIIAGAIVLLMGTATLTAQDNVWEREEKKAAEIQAEEPRQTRNESAVVTDSRKGVLKVCVSTIELQKIEY